MSLGRVYVRGEISGTGGTALADYSQVHIKLLFLCFQLVLFL